MKKIDICISTDDNYAKYCAAVINSIIKNKGVDDAPVFHILHGGLSERNIRLLSEFAGVHFYKLENELFNQYVKDEKHAWPAAAYYRLKLPSILNDIDKVIYLDCDVIVTQSLSEYYDIDIEDYYLAAVPDTCSNLYMSNLGIPDENGYFYFNSGSLLMNLKKFREDNIEQKLFDCMQEIWKTSTFIDQDVLNLVLYKKTKRLDRRYNFVPLHDDHKQSKNYNLAQNVTIIHYAGQKPWEFAFISDFRDEFWKYYKTQLVSAFQFKKEYFSYLFAKLKIIQIFGILKTYPTAPFRKSKWCLFEKLFEF